MKTKFHESNARSIIKAITFRGVILVSDAVIIYLITRRADLTIGVMILSNISSTVLYFLHERAWNNAHWGKVKQSR